MAKYKDEEIKGWKISKTPTGNYYVYHISDPVGSRKTLLTKNKKDAIRLAKLHKISFDYEAPDQPIFKKPPSDKVEQQRIERLSTQPSGYPGTTQAIVDSSKMYKDMGPQFKPEHIKKTEKLKTVRTEIKKLKTDIEKLKTETEIIDNWDKGSVEWKTLKSYPDKYAKYLADKKKLTLKIKRLENIKTKYPDYNVDDPINILD